MTATLVVKKLRWINIQQNQQRTIFLLLVSEKILRREGIDSCCNCIRQKKSNPKHFRPFYYIVRNKLFDPWLSRLIKSRYLTELSKFLFSFSWGCRTKCSSCRTKPTGYLRHMWSTGEARHNRRLYHHIKDRSLAHLDQIFPLPKKQEKKVL